MQNEDAKSSTSTDIEDDCFVEDIEVLFHLFNELY